jgi:hypothetical protein
MPDLTDIKARFAGIHCEQHPWLQSLADRAIDDAYAAGVNDGTNGKAEDA